MTTTNTPPSVPAPPPGAVVRVPDRPITMHELQLLDPPKQAATGPTPSGFEVL